MYVLHLYIVVVPSGFFDLSRFINRGKYISTKNKNKSKANNA